MRSKNSFLSGRDLERPGKRLRSNLAHLNLSGQVSAQRAAGLFTDAAAAGASRVNDLAAAEGKNGQRDLRRKLLNHRCTLCKYQCFARKPTRSVVRICRSCSLVKLQLWLLRETQTAPCLLQSTALAFLGDKKKSGSCACQMAM